MARFDRLSRWTQVFVAAMVLVLTMAVMVRAEQTIDTPNALVVNYNLVAGANSAAVKPVSSLPVLVTGVQNALGYRGVGEVSLLHVPSSFLEWVGIESPAAAAITSGFFRYSGDPYSLPRLQSSSRYPGGEYGHIPDPQCELDNHDRNADSDLVIVRRQGKNRASVATGDGCLQPTQVGTSSSRPWRWLGALTGFGFMAT